MYYEYEGGRIDVQAVELEARRMRAQAVREVVLAARSWVRGLFGRTNSSAAKHA